QGRLQSGPDCAIGGGFWQRVPSLVVYQFVVTRRAARDIAQLPPEVRERLRDALEKYRDEPRAHARKIVDSSLGGYRFRIGEYRDDTL
ncbi:MAG: hypothetical protein Q8R28_02480, partial [Dehalococcoidia bacterium]|nr:hypothetical protein [Dehalococcoidia bacterium]